MDATLILDVLDYVLALITLLVLVFSLGRKNR